MQHYYHPIPSSYGAYGVQEDPGLLEEAANLPVGYQQEHTQQTKPPAPSPTKMLKNYGDSPWGKVKMLTTPIAMGVGYYRTKSIWKAFLLGFISTPYLAYVAATMIAERSQLE